VIGVGGVNLGRAFCIVCLDSSLYLFEEESPFLDVDGMPLLLSDLTEFDDGEIDITDHPILGRNNYRDDHRPVATEIGPTVFLDVPEPATLATFMAGLIGIGITRRRRATK
jgi:hypothetical protein